LGKLNARGERTIFIGFEEGTSNSLHVVQKENRFLRSRDARFLEDVYPARGDSVPDITSEKMQTPIMVAQ